MGFGNELERIIRFRDEGELSEAEFLAAKALILGAPAVQPPAEPLTSADKTELEFLRHKERSRSSRRTDETPKSNPRSWRRLKG